MSDEEAATPGERYERDMVPVLFIPFGRDLVDRLQLHPGMRVADIGCGTGILARLVGERLDETSVVAGVDINAGMLDVARAKTAGLRCRLEWHEAPAEALPLADESFDLLLCQFAFMLFTDKTAAAREMYRVLRPGGAAYVSAWCHFSRQPNYAVLVDGLGRFVGGRAQDLIKGAFQYESEDQIHAPFLDGGFRDVPVEIVRKEVVFRSTDWFVRSVVGGSILARMGVEIAPGTLDELCAFVSDELKRYEVAGRLEVPMECYLARSVKPSR